MHRKEKLSKEAKQEHWVLAKDLSKMLQRPVSVKSINRWRKAGKIPYYRVDSRYYYNPEEVREVLREKYHVEALS